MNRSCSNGLFALVCLALATSADCRSRSSTTARLRRRAPTRRGNRRHGGAVTRVRLYRLKTNAGQRYLLVYLTSAGTVTDYDVVTR